MRGVGAQTTVEQGGAVFSIIRLRDGILVVVVDGDCRQWSSRHDVTTTAGTTGRLGRTAGRRLQKNITFFRIFWLNLVFLILKFKISQIFIT